jgi:hypothetical protein
MWFLPALLVIGFDGFDRSNEAVAPQAAAPASKRASTDDLAALATAVAGLDEFKDNQFLYEEQSQKLVELGKRFEQSAIDYVATVTRVTKGEVFLAVEDSGKARVVIRHQQPPLFGNLGSVVYGGGPTTNLANVFARPVALRIGSEIPLDVARRLRKDDNIVLRGRIDSLEVRIPCVFNPYVLAVIADWKIINAAPAAP